MAFVATAIGAGLGYAALGTAGAALTGAGIGATIGGSLNASKASKEAAQTQAAAAGNAQQVQWNMFEKQQENLKPWLESGKANLATLNDLMKSGDWQKDPQYQFLLKQGANAVEQSSAPRWGAESGATLKALSDYGQGMASNEINNIYNRYASMSGVGQAAANQIGGAGQNYANNASDLITGAANAQAAGQVGSANALSQGVSGALGAYQNFNLMNLLGQQNINPSAQFPQFNNTNFLGGP